jgi:hypothetical protein
MRPGARTLAAAVAAACFAAITWATPTQVGCGAADTACGPAIVRALGVTTTTLGGTPAPSWVAFTIGAWMLDEPTPGARVNAQGTTARNLSESGPVPNDTTNKMEGTAAANPSSLPSFLFTADTTIQGIAPPFTCVIWARYTGTDTAQLPAVFRTAASPGFDGMRLSYDNHAQHYFAQTGSPNTVV